MKIAQLSENVASLLFNAGVLSSRERDDFSGRYSMTPITADGSERLFFRVARHGESLCIGVSPHDGSARNLAEALSAMAIGRHLFAQDVPVPRIVGADPETGLILFEDCGDIRLHDVLKKTEEGSAAEHDTKMEIYRRLIQVLAHMQSCGARGFNRQWCYDTPEYDTDVMVKKESEYFLNEFWHNLLQGEHCPGIAEEFADIALNGGRGLRGFFLHRDFQCRNIMMSGTEIKIIDFQGGRLGPPAYDLASLLIDPYSDLTEEMRAALVRTYLAELHKYSEYDEQVFLRQYIYLALQRNLQILGAFSFLSQTRGKSFFQRYIHPALQSLSGILEKEELRGYSQLRRIVTEAQRRLHIHS
jgi:hypothetical protein